MKNPKGERSKTLNNSQFLIHVKYNGFSLDIIYEAKRNLPTQKRKKNWCLNLIVENNLHKANTYKDFKSYISRCITSIRKSLDNYAFHIPFNMIPNIYISSFESNTRIRIKCDIYFSHHLFNVFWNHLSIMLDRSSFTELWWV